MRRLALLLAAAVIVAWAAPVSADTLENKGFYVTVYNKDWSVRDQGFLVFLPRGRLACYLYWGGKYEDGYWEETQYPGYTYWEGWYASGDPCPYDEFEAYYFPFGSSEWVYGLVQPRGQHTNLLFAGQLLGPLF